MNKILLLALFGLAGCTFPWMQTEEHIVEDVVHDIDESAHDYEKINGQTPHKTHKAHIEQHRTHAKKK